VLTSVLARRPADDAIAHHAAQAHLEIMADDTEPSPQRLLSSTVVGGIAGGLLVGSATAVIAFFFIGPLLHFHFDLAETLLVSLVGGMFGVVAGAVAGASEVDQVASTPTIQTITTKPARPSMTPAHRGV
jgi:hypothetical protein